MGFFSYTSFYPGGLGTSGHSDNSVHSSQRHHAKSQDYTVLQWSQIVVSADKGGGGERQGMVYVPNQHGSNAIEKGILASCWWVFSNYFLHGFPIEIFPVLLNKQLSPWLYNAPWNKKKEVMAMWSTLRGMLELSNLMKFPEGFGRGSPHAFQINLEMIWKHLNFNIYKNSVKICKGLPNVRKYALRKTFNKRKVKSW